MGSWSWIVWLVVTGLSASPGGTTRLEFPLTDAGEVDLTRVVAALAETAGTRVELPPGLLRVPIRGVGGSLTTRLLAQKLGSGVTFSLGPDRLRIDLTPELFQPEHRPAFEERIRAVALTLRQTVGLSYGMHALRSYRPNDPGRPTICLVHGLNSSSDVFIHLIGPLEAAGFGIVVYDFPYNRDLDETSAAFGRDWAAFRGPKGEKQPWAIVAHSMGSLLARWYVEADPTFGGDVSTLLLLAPPNRGSGLAKAQTLLQLVDGLRAINEQKAHALTRVSEGLGAAADDMMPGSAFLEALNERPRRAGVRYATLAGDFGLLSPAARLQLETQIGVLGRSGGLFGGLARWAAGDLRSGLDEVTDGLGDGCVSVASTRLDGVADHRTIRANHLELIRAPLLYPDPGPVVSMPFLLDHLHERSSREDVRAAP